jgi:capsular exopolysaccharide synthesis family protein
VSNQDLTHEIKQTLMLDHLNPGDGAKGETVEAGSVITEEKVSDKLIVLKDPRSLECEYFRFLKSRVIRYFNEESDSEDGKVIMVTGASLGGGKTVCSLNLALAFSRSFGSRTLFMDSDTRNRKVESYLGIDEDSYPDGLTDVMSLATRAGSVLINTGLSDLIYFPSGGFREDFADHLKGNDIEILLQNLRKRFQYIIVDAPPVFPMPETTLLAGLSDAVLVVMGAGMDGKPQLDHTMELLDGANVIGVILNRIKAAPGVRYGAHGYY